MADYFLRPAYDAISWCKSMNDYGYSKDENGDWLITDCQKTGFSDYFSSPENMKAFDALYENKDGL